MVTLAIVGLAAILIVTMLTANFATYLDFGAGVAFVIAPIIALLNHLAVFGKAVPRDKRPSKLLQVWSITGIVIMAAIAVAYLRIAYF